MILDMNPIIYYIGYKPNYNLEKGIKKYIEFVTYFDRNNYE